MMHKAQLNKSKKGNMFTQAFKHAPNILFPVLRKIFFVEVVKAMEQ